MKLELMRGITGVVNIVVVVLVCSAKPASSGCKTAGSQPAQQLATDVCLGRSSTKYSTGNRNSPMSNVQHVSRF